MGLSPFHNQYTYDLLLKIQNLLLKRQILSKIMLIMLPFACVAPELTPSISPLSDVFQPGKFISSFGLLWIQIFIQTNMNYLMC